MINANNNNIKMPYQTLLKKPKSEKIRMKTNQSVLIKLSEINRMKSNIEYKFEDDFLKEKRIEYEQKLV